MANELSVEKAIDVLYTIRAYYASMTAGYPKGKDCIGIGDVMCSEIANSCLMAIIALESQKWIPISERLPEERNTYEVTLQGIGELEGIDNEVAYATWLGENGDNWIYHNVDDWKDKKVIAWKPLTKPYKEESEDKEWDI